MDSSHHPEDHTRVFKQKFWISLLFTIPTLLFSHTVQGWLGLHFTFAGSQYIPALFGVIIFFYGGLVFLKGALAEVRSRQPGMMSLISMAILVAFSYSLAATFGFAAGMDFWWELATLITIMLLGHWLEMMSVAKAQNSLQELAKLLPRTAELATGKSLPVSQLKPGDIVLVKPGSHIPADGIVQAGISDVNEALLTGESQPVSKSKGARVIGGTLNSNGSLTIKLTKTGKDTALAGIIKLVSQALQTKSRTQILADRAAFYLTFVALGVAIITGVSWASAGQSREFILERVVTVLVVACPHALGLAIPLVAAISTTLAAKHGLLIRTRPSLEAARNIDVVLFDKTGTLTKGELSVVNIMSPGDKSDADQLLKIAAAIETHSEHSIASAIVALAKQRQLAIPKASHFTSFAGRGVKAMVQRKTYHIGKAQLIKDLNISIPPALKAAAATSKDTSVVYITDKKSVLGLIFLADTIRRESLEAISALQSLGKRVVMITGDNANTAKQVAAQLGIQDYFAEVLPKHKSTVIKNLQTNGSQVAMVGDGVNDAPALAQANLGIAIGAGTDIAVETADVILTSNDPRSIAKLIHLSKATYAKMSQNLAWAAGYNVIALPLAAGITAPLGFVPSPAFGAVLMSVSTIIVAINAQFLRRVKLN